MADSLATNVRVMLYGTDTHTLDLIASIPANIAIDFPSVTGQVLATGTGDQQADLFWSDSRSCTVSAPDLLDLEGANLHAGYTALTSNFGATLTFAKVKVLAIYNKDTTRDLRVGADALHPWFAWCDAATDYMVIPPLGVRLLTAPKAGFAVTAGTGDLLKIVPSADVATAYDIVIIGTSA